MGKRSWIIIGVFVLVVSILGFSQASKKVYSGATTCDQADENERFKCKSELFNNAENRESRADNLAVKKTAEAKNKAEAIQDKGEGQFKLKF